MLATSSLSGKKEGGVDNAAVIAGESLRVLKDACDLLFLDGDRILTELTVKVTYAGRLDLLWCCLIVLVQSGRYSW